MFSEQEFYSSTAGSRAYIQRGRVKKWVPSNSCKFFFHIGVVSQALLPLSLLKGWLSAKNTTTNNGTQIFWGGTLLITFRSPLKAVLMSPTTLLPVYLSDYKENAFYKAWVLSCESSNSSNYKFICSSCLCDVGCTHMDYFI